MYALLAPHSLLGWSPRASGKYRAGADFSDDKAMVRPGVATRGGSRETGVDPSAGLWAEELNGCRCRPIGAWTPSQPVGCQGDILLCSKGARRWAPLRAPPRLRSPTGTRQTRQCLRYSCRPACADMSIMPIPPSGRRRPVTSCWLGLCAIRTFLDSVITYLTYPKPSHEFGPFRIRATQGECFQAKPALGGTRETRMAVFNMPISWPAGRPCRP